MFHQSVTLPIIIEDVNLVSLKLKQLLANYNLTFRNILLITGSKNSSFYAETIAKNNKELNLFLHKDTVNSISEVNKLRELVLEKKIRLILGVGGGKVLDTAKFLAAKLKLCYIAVPTQISSDALASPISILNNQTITKSYPARIPSGILIDYSIVSSVAKKHIISGIGDILSNLSALKDWDIAVKEGKEKPNNFAYSLSEIAVNYLFNKAIEPQKKSFMKCYVNSIILSGLAMNIAGNSRPCSGSEHLLAHSLKKMNLSHHNHGYIVGALTPFILFLHKSLDSITLEYFRRASLPITFEAIIEKNFSLEKVFNTARTIRKKRFTILNQFNDNQLINKYREFCDLHDHP